MHTIQSARDSQKLKTESKAIPLIHITSQVSLLLPSGMTFTLCCNHARPCQGGQNPLAILVVESLHFIMFGGSAP